MPKSRREVMEAVQTRLLAAGVVSAGRAFLARAETVQANEVPCVNIVVRTTSSTLVPGYALGSEPVWSRSLSLEVACYARGDDDDAADDTVDTLVNDVATALLDPTWYSTAIGSPAESISTTHAPGNPKAAERVALAVLAIDIVQDGVERGE